MRLWKHPESFSHTHVHMIHMLNLARGASMKDSPRSRQMLKVVINNLIDTKETNLNITSNREQSILKISCPCTYANRHNGVWLLLLSDSP